MKNIFAIIIFIIIGSLTNAQWILDPAPTGKWLNRVRLISSSAGWIVGETGTILRTTNGGTSWQTQSSGTTIYLNDVSFTDANNGTVVGEGGTILHTTNGGSTWQSQSSGTTNILYGVSFTDANNGTVVGDAGTILHTTDGGSTWLTQSSEATRGLFGVSFTDINNGIVVGYGWNGITDLGIIIRTTNGGATWFTQTSGITLGLFGVAFTDSNTGIAVGGGGSGNTSTDIILRTTNGGTTWTQQLIISGSGLGSFCDVSFSDPNNGAVVNFKNNGPIWRTTDGGTSWHAQITPYHGPLYSVSFADDKSGIAVGTYGTILRTTNGGVTFIGNDNKNSDPQEFTLAQNYPNPFNPTTTINYSLTKDGNVKLTIYNAIGSKVATIVNEYKPAGNYSVQFNATNLASGIYLYRLESGNYTAAKKFILLK